MTRRKQDWPLEAVTYRPAEAVVVDGLRASSLLCRDRFGVRGHSIPSGRSERSARGDGALAVSLGGRCGTRWVAVRGCVEVGRLVHEGVDEIAGVEADRAGDLDELDHVEPALAGLVLVDPLLRVAEAFAQGGLGQAGAQAHLSQVAAQPCGYGVEVRTGHDSCGVAGRGRVPQVGVPAGRGRC